MSHSPSARRWRRVSLTAVELHPDHHPAGRGHRAPAPAGRHCSRFQLMTAAPTRAGLFRLLPGLLTVLVSTVVAGVALAGPAAAHNVLIASDPVDGAVLQQSPATVSLTFDQPVQDFEPIVTVVGPDGQRYESGAPVVAGTVVSTQVSALPAAGSYVIAYRVVSADGHPVQGELTFELAAVAPTTAAPTTAAPTTAASASSSASTTASSAASTSAASTSAAPPTPTTSAAAATAAESSGLTGWMWAAIVLAALLVASAVAVVIRRPRQRSS